MELFLCIISPRVTTLLTLKHSNRSVLSISNKHEAKENTKRITRVTNTKKHYYLITSMNWCKIDNGTLVVRIIVSHDFSKFYIPQMQYGRQDTVNGIYLFVNKADFFKSVFKLSELIHVVLNQTKNIYYNLIKQMSKTSKLNVVLLV